MSKYRILIVENDFYIRLVLNTYFTEKGYNTFISTNGQCGLNLAQNEYPHIAIINDDLPDMSGKELIDQLLAQATTCVIHMLHIVGKSYRLDDRIYDLDLRPERMVDEITMPFDIEELKIRVENAIARIERSEQFTAHPITGLVFTYPEVAFDERFNRTTKQFLDSKASTILDIRIDIQKGKDSQINPLLTENFLRTFAYTLAEAIRDYGTPNDMLVHGENEHFAILTDDEHAPEILGYMREQKFGRHAYKFSTVMISNTGYQWTSREEMRVAIEAMHTEQLQ